MNSNGLEVGGGMEWAGLAWSHVGRVPKYQVRKKNKIRQLWFGFTKKQKSTALVLSLVGFWVNRKA